MAKIPDRKNMTTADILAFCRAEVASDSSSAAAAEDVAEPATAAEELPETPAETVAESKPAAPKKKPTSTKDILAAARATAGGAAEKKSKSPASPPAAAAKAPPAGKPKSTKDILAAARAGAAGGSAGSTPDKPVAAEKKKSSPAPAAASGEKPSVKEMLAAFREERQAPASQPKSPDGPRVPPKLPVPPRTAKVKAAPAPVVEERRSFLAALLVIPSAFVAAWIMFTTSAFAWTLALVKFALPNVLVEPPSKFKIGSPSDYDFGTVSTKWKAQRGIWVVHTDRYKGKNIIVALSTVCTHLGCTPNWLEGEQKYKCPCHGSGFYIDGINFEGPAPRPLERHGISVAADGMLEVDKSLKFQEEMGQWEDPKSFVPV